MRRVARGMVAALAVLVLGACNHGTPGCTLPPQTFNAPALVIPTLISPASGATAVSTGPLDVTIGNAVSVVALYVQAGSGNPLYATVFRQANPPSNDVRIGTFPQLASQTTYQVYASEIGASPPYNPCGPNPAVAPALVPLLLGSFTTR
ncbi:MAG TPA: hypothetical protein VIW69_02100 [Candidatus Elarobacter sp.]